MGHQFCCFFIHELLLDLVVAGNETARSCTSEHQFDTLQRSGPLPPSHRYVCNHVSLPISTCGCVHPLFFLSSLILYSSLSFCPIPPCSSSSCDIFSVPSCSSFFLKDLLYYHKALLGLSRDVPSEGLLDPGILCGYCNVLDPRMLSWVLGLDWR